MTDSRNAPTIRPATPDDRDALGRMGAALLHQHHDSDPARFLHVESPEAGYGRFLVAQITDPRRVVLVAEVSGDVVGYVFGEIADTDWMQLRGPCGIVQDVFVEPRARGLGAGRALLEAAIAWMHARGRDQVVLMTKTRNEAAQRLFASLGFRPTMVEMTRDGADPVGRGTPA